MKSSLSLIKAKKKDFTLFYNQFYAFVFFVITLALIVHWFFFAIFWTLNYQLGWLWSFYLGLGAILLWFSYKGVILTLKPGLSNKFVWIDLGLIISGFLISEALFLGFVIISGILEPTQYPRISLQFIEQIFILIVEIPAILLLSLQLWLYQNPFSQNLLLNFIFYLFWISSLASLPYIMFKNRWKTFMTSSINGQSKQELEDWVQPLLVLIIFFTWFLRFSAFPVHEEEYLLGWFILLAILGFFISKRLNITDFNIYNLRIFIILLFWFMLQNLIVQKSVLRSFISDISHYLELVGIPATFALQLILISIDLAIISVMWLGTKNVNSLLIRRRELIVIGFSVILLLIIIP